jgi:hypothetical protein
MTGPLSSPEQDWIRLDGTWGEFAAPGTQVPVLHLSTYASLADSGTGHTRLTRDLLPVREMFDVGELNFDELLQRDLDDYRVAKEIIPYLLRSSESVRFFPPILAVLVPVSNKKIQELYPKPQRTEKPHDQGEYQAVTDRYGGCFEVVRYRSAVGGAFASSAVLKFNPDQARLIVIDGQHRAMAMLAVRRHKTGDWGDKGRDFKHFYEDLATELKTGAEALDRVQMPVCLCVFPSLHSGADGTTSTTTVQCCRKLFLDVNKNAKRPSRARQLLLDDSDLLSAITRSVLTRVRSDAAKSPNPTIELDAFEYDAPQDQSGPQRHLAICTVEMLRQLVYWAAFGPQHFYAAVERRPQGRPAKPLGSRFLSEVGFDHHVSTQDSRSWGYRDFEQEFDPTDCRSAAQPKLSALFVDGWGRVIISILADLHPFRAHNQAVSALRAAHQAETGHGALAWRALFDGQGVFWTVENYANDRETFRREQVKAGAPKPPEGQLEKAYRAIRDEWIPREFVPTRASNYLQKKVDKLTEADRRVAGASYDVFITQAFQIGVLMAFAHLKYRLELSDTTKFLAAAAKWVEVLNDAMQKDAVLRAFDRDPQAKGFMSRYPGTLQPADWFWFRYFIFELLGASKKKFDGRDESRDAAGVCRRLFVNFLADYIFRQDQKFGDEITKEQALERAVEKWRDVLKATVGLDKKDFDEWWASAGPTAATVDADAAADERADASEADEDAT